MAKILNIETSTTVCSVSVGIDGVVASLKEVNDGYSHAEQIESLMVSALDEAGLGLVDLDAISVSKGPGSFTGLRIGVSLVKGLCYGLKIPLISVPTLEAMALHPQVIENAKFYKVPMLDARRMEVYSCVLDTNNEVVEATSAVVVDVDSYGAYLTKEPVLFFGPGMAKIEEVLSVYENAEFVHDVFPSAQYMTGISEMKFKKRDFENVAYFEPFYLKDFVAGKPKKLL